MEVEVLAKIEELFGDETREQRDLYVQYCQKAKIKHFRLTPARALKVLEAAGWNDANLDEFVKIFREPSETPGTTF